jgi:hypothetical protein
MLDAIVPEDNLQLDQMQLLDPDNDDELGISREDAAR